MFFIYLWYPRTKGTTYIYGTFFRPYISQHEIEIDRNLLELRARASNVVVLYFQKASTIGQNTFFDILKYVAAQTPSQKSKQQHSQLADVWSYGVTLYVMLVGAYPFEDQDDPKNIKKIIPRISAIDYIIPDHILISADCRQLISLIFVSNPMRRITMKKINSHPWFLKNLPRELTKEAQFVYYRRNNSISALSGQTTQEIMQIVQEARRMPRSPRPSYAYSDDELDEEEPKEEENEPEENKEEDERDKRARELCESGELNLSSLRI